MTLAKDLRRQAKRPEEPLFGRALTEDMYNNLSNDQIGQLYELFKVKKATPLMRLCEGF